MAKRITKAAVITVDIKNDDEKDIKRGGPKYLSHKFIVDYDEVDNMLVLVENVFNRFKIPYSYIYMLEYTFVDKNIILSSDSLYKEICRRFNIDETQYIIQNHENRLVLK